jgi:phosphohistidine phosphatase SixA
MRVAPALAMLVSFLICAPALAARAVIVIRHAEKSTEPAGDPDLSIPGEDRAIALTRFLRHDPVDAIFVSEYRRTQQTAAVLARQRGVTPVVVKADETATLVEKIKALPKDAVVVVVGHSNTVPEILTALGVKEKVSIRDDEYSRVFVVTPTLDPGAMQLLEFAY